MKSARIATLTLCLALAPALVQAKCFGDPTVLVTSCAVGQVFDADSQSCVVTTG